MRGRIGSRSPSLTMSSLQDETEQLKEELKEAIVERYETDRGRASVFDESILEDQEEKMELFEDSGIYDLLEAYVDSLPTPPRRIQPGEHEKRLWRELEEVLREMTMEAEGIVA